MGERIYAAIDLKSFYASVECVERGLDPLTANLVVADLRRTEKTICLAVSPSLKRYGLSGRSRLFEVMEKAREVEARTGQKLEYIVAPPRMRFYMDYSARIYQKVYLRYLAPEDFIESCFRILKPYIKSTHIKDTRMNPTRLTAMLEECFPGEGTLDYARVLRIMDQFLPSDAPVLLEHMQTAEEYRTAYDYVAGVAARSGISV